MQENRLGGETCRKLGALLVAAVLAAGAVSGCARETGAPASESQARAWMDPSLAPRARAEALVARMTLREKAEQVGHTAPAIPHLGVPAYNWWNEGLHGVARAGHATVFPQAIGLAASFDTELMLESAQIIGREFRAKYNETVGEDGSSDWYRGLTVWSPNINIFRDPRWGRGQETYGEDPYLTGRMALAFIRGLQGDDPEAFQTIATAKHYAVHSGPESNRHREDVYPSPFDLEDTYLPAFRTAVVEGGVGSIMCAYNAVDGIPACGHDRLMNRILRDEWGFDGYVVSDCGGAANSFREDALAYSPTPEAGVALAFNSGMDLVCGDYRNNMSTEVEPIMRAVESGLLDEAVLDEALVRLFTARIRLGLFDPEGSRAFADIPATAYDTPEHRDVALRMAEASLVLLRNEGDFLPLAEAPSRIAVIGPNADSYDALVGNYNGIPTNYVTVLDGIRQRFADSEVVYAMGSGLVGPAEPDVPASRFCRDAACRETGLWRETLAGPALDDPVTAREAVSDTRVLWSGEIRNHTVRWTGFLRVGTSGAYRLRRVTGDGYRISVDGQVVTDAWLVDHPPSIAGNPVTLEADRTYPIRIEALQDGPRGDQRLVWTPPGDAQAEAVDLAAGADLAIVVAGLSWRVEGEEMRVDAEGFSGGDRTSIALPAPQQRLLEAVHATGTPTILVLMSGSALAVNWADDNIPAIIQAGYPGGEGGLAVAGLLAGDFSPSGRLPYTVNRTAGDLPPFTDYAMAGRTYRYFDGEVLYPFGHGLSYTRFSYGDPVVTGPADTSSGLILDVPVTNTGAHAGREIVQLYLARPGIEGAPLRTLQGFRSVMLAPGETRQVRFQLAPRAFSTVTATGERRVEPGPVILWIGGGQPIAVGERGLPAGAALEVGLEGQAVTLSTPVP